MSAVASPVDICNLSLDDLKQAPITNIATPVTTTEFVCARNYDTVRREALFNHPWKFAITRVQLTPAGVPVFGYAYTYDLPSDYLRMISVGDDYFGDLRMEREVENNQILAQAGDSVFDGTTLNVRYMKDITDVTKFSPGFVSYLRLLLAIRMSNKFSISATVKRGLKEDFAEVETAAKAVNGQENRIKRIQFSRVLTKRRGLASGLYASKYSIFDS